MTQLESVWPNRPILDSQTIQNVLYWIFGRYSLVIVVLFQRYCHKIRQKINKSGSAERNLSLNESRTKAKNETDHWTWHDARPSQRFKIGIFVVKDGESSSQFRWFTIGKIELYFLIFFVLILRLRLQRFSTNTKRYPRKKSFCKLLSFALPAKP